MQKKLELYEKFFKEMKRIDEEASDHNTNIMDDSIIIEKDLEGNHNKKVPSDLTESFLIIDKVKDLTRLSQKEQKAVNEQNNLHNYNKLKQYGKNAGVAYGVLGYVWSIGKWFAFL